MPVRPTLIPAEILEPMKAFSAEQDQRCAIIIAAISHPCASSWSIVSGASAAAKLDAASIVAKNRLERMQYPKAAGGFFQRNRPGFFCTNTVQSIGAH